MRKYSKINNIVNGINATITENVKERMTGKRLTFMALTNQEINIEPFEIRYPDDRIWTRNDGVRYKDAGYINVLDSKMLRMHRRYSSFKTLHPGKQALLNYFWETLKEMPRSKDMGTLSGCFSSDKHCPALRAGGLLWVKRLWGIEYGSMSRLNSGVWINTPAKEKETI